jgi:hypothetical protein
VGDLSDLISTIYLVQSQPLDEMTFHLLFIELIRVRRAHPLRVVEAFLREMKKREVEQTKRGVFCC